ncbi:unnamed protein product [Hymenolepis diminuta]|uniref:Essential MCU regulator, mitochondrial n=1 Tax=Hymenolepis diminuta TaxID=6216 RepID=A0A0R3S7L4_HYMDI|nr:unnamed protein product [Hymenolepis diminuta]
MAKLNEKVLKVVRSNARFGVCLRANVSSSPEKPDLMYFRLPNIFSTNMCHSATSIGIPAEETRCSDQCPILLRTFSHILRITGPCLLLVGVILMVFDFCNNRSEGRSFSDSSKTLETL